MKATAHFSLKTLTNLGPAITKQLNNSSPGPIRNVFVQWAARYRSFVQERFDTYSKGGGDWAPHSPATRRKRGKNATLLRDTNTMFTALSPVFDNQPGAIEEHRPGGVTVGFGGPHKYPNGITIADVAALHNAGATNLPQRRIIVPPSGKVVAAMKEDLVIGVKKVKESL